MCVLFERQTAGIGVYAISIRDSFSVRATKTMHGAIYQRCGYGLLIAITISTISVSAHAQVPPDTARCDYEYFPPTGPVIPTMINDFWSLFEQIQYPETAIAAKLEGRIVVMFVIDEEGRGTSFETRPIALDFREPPVAPADSIAAVEALSREAVRIVKMVRFRQVVQCNGKIEKIRMALPVLFRLPQE